MHVELPAGETNVDAVPGHTAPADAPSSEGAGLEGNGDRVLKEYSNNVKLSANAIK